jgi:hypothetical protein
MLVSKEHLTDFPSRPILVLKERAGRLKIKSIHNQIGLRIQRQKI